MLICCAAVVWRGVVCVCVCCVVRRGVVWCVCGVCVPCVWLDVCVLSLSHKTSISRILFVPNYTDYKSLSPWCSIYYPQIERSEAQKAKRRVEEKRAVEQARADKAARRAAASRATEGDSALPLHGGDTSDGRDIGQCILDTEACFGTWIEEEAVRGGRGAFESEAARTRVAPQTGWAGDGDGRAVLYWC